MTAVDDFGLAEAIRALARAHLSGVLDEPARTEVAELITRAEAMIRTEGAPRVRWYEADAGATAMRSRHRELSPFSGATNAAAPPMVIDAATGPDERPELVGRVRLDRTREGPPRSVHGGVMAGLFDELLGAAQRLGGSPGGVTGRLTVRYRRPTPIDEELELRAWVTDTRSRRVTARAECRVVGPDGPGPVTAEADAVFVVVDFDRMARGAPS